VAFRKFLRISDVGYPQLFQIPERSATQFCISIDRARQVTRYRVAAKQEVRDVLAIESLVALARPDHSLSMSELGLKEGQIVFVQNNVNEEEDSDDESTWSPLQLASQTGNLTLVSDLLSKGVNPNEPPKGWYGKSALQGQLILLSFLVTAP
jgi:hypothetical protein